MTAQRIRNLAKLAIGRMRPNGAVDGYLMLVVLAAVSRLMPHPSNVTAIGALGLFVGARGQSRRGWIAPLLVLLATDLWLGGYAPVSMLFVYGGFAAGAAIGRWWLQGRTGMGQIALASAMMSTTFFVVSNFGWWLSGSDYPLTFGGLRACYIAALPWFLNSLVGDLLYSLLLIGSYDWIGSRMQSSAPRAIERAVES